MSSFSWPVSPCCSRTLIMVTWASLDCGGQWWWVTNPSLKHTGWHWCLELRVKHKMAATSHCCLALPHQPRHTSERATLSQVLPGVNISPSQHNTIWYSVRHWATAAISSEAASGSCHEPTLSHAESGSIVAELWMRWYRALQCVSVVEVWSCPAHSPGLTPTLWRKARTTEYRAEDNWLLKLFKYR